MAIHYRQILELHAQELVQRDIAAITGNSRPKISEVIKQAELHQISPPFTDDVDDIWLESLLFPQKQPMAKGRQIPDFEKIHEELAKPNVTLSLVHYEYEQECRQNGTIPYAYRTFCQYYRAYAQKYKATMRIRRKPGEVMEVDWAGSPLHIVDRETGEIIKAYLFIASLPCSAYSYCEAFMTEQQEAWLTGHIHAYEFFGGVTQYLISDNLKTGVTSHKHSEIILNEMYRDLALHYGTIVMPARVRKPKDKPTVEGVVGTVSTWIIAALRNETFFGLEELNKAVRIKLKEFNERPFTKKYKQGSRLSAFHDEESFALRPLPVQAYTMASWRTAIVQLDYHINVESQFYSVPYEYISSKVDIKVTKDIVEVFYKGNRIASHKRLTGKFGQFSTNHDHLPAEHKLFVDHTPENALAWAEEVGINTLAVMRYLLKSAASEKQGLSAAFRFKGLARKYAAIEIEAACTTVMKIATAPTVSVVERVLKSQKTPAPKTTNEPDYGFTRGAAYFGGND